MSDVRERYARLFRRGEGTERVQFFSDAVFAIALTLLVLDIRLPETATDENLLSSLLSLWPQYFAFALSFVIIAVNWMSHHAKFLVIERFDPGLVRLNFVVLFLIVIVPFPTSVLSEHGPETPAVVLYASAVAALGLAQLVMWAYAVRNGLVSRDVDGPMFLYVVLNILPAPLVFLLSIPVALISAEAAMYAWFAIIPVSIAAGVLSSRVGGPTRTADRRNR